jgi:hypothetical protein
MHSLDSGFQIGCAFRIPQIAPGLGFHIPPVLGFWIALSGFQIAKLLKVGLFWIPGSPSALLNEA